MKATYDVVIVGGGIAGALVAYKLAQTTSLSILILEAGADRSTERTQMSLAYAKAKVKSPGSPYKYNSSATLPFPDSTKPTKSDYYRYQPGSTEFKSTYVKIGGGSTWHWLGNCPRFLPNDFAFYSQYGKGFDWPVTYDELEPYYCQAEHELGISGNHEQWDNLFGATRSQPFPMPEIWPTYSDSVLKPKLQGPVEIDQLVYEVKIRSTPQARNSQAYQGRPACGGNSSCVPICPIGAKYDASVHLQLANSLGVEIAYESIVFKLEANEKGLISRVYFRNWDHQESAVTGTIVVLATHAIESAVLLQTSGVANSSGKVGKFLMDHPQGYGVGILPEPLFPFRGPPTTSGIDVFRDGEFRKKHSAFRISMGNDGWGRFNGIDKLEDMLDKATSLAGTFLLGNRLKDAIKQEGIRLFRFSYSTEMLPIESNCVIPSQERDARTGLPFPSINFQVDNEQLYNRIGFEFAGKVLQALFEKAGASNVQIIDDVSHFSGAGHIMGTTKMGLSKTDSVVDKHCRSHEHANFFIVGAGVFPTCGTANPTLTVAALALRLAETIGQEFASTSFA